LIAAAKFDGGTRGAHPSLAWQVVVGGDGGGVPDPRADHGTGEPRGQVGPQARPQVVEQLRPRLHAGCRLVVIPLADSREVCYTARGCVSETKEGKTMEWRHRWWRGLSGVVGLLPFATAVLAHYGLPSEPAEVAFPPRPALAFDQYVVDLRKIEPTTEAHAVFVFRNRSSRVAKIVDVRPSCGCLAPLVEPRTVEPGGVGRLVLKIQPANEAPGQKEYHADVTYTDPEPREVRLVFKVELPEQGLTVRPRALLVYQNGGKPIHEQLIVADSRANPVQIEDVAVNNPLVEVALGDRRIAPDGTIEQAIHVVIAEDVPPGVHRALVTIHTSDPRQGVLRVPLRIEHGTYGRTSSHGE
jgi:hypothetical protein